MAQILVDVPDTEVTVVVHTRSERKNVQMTLATSDTAWQVKINVYERERWLPQLHPTATMISYEGKILEDHQPLLSQVSPGGVCFQRQNRRPTNQESIVVDLTLAPNASLVPTQFAGTKEKSTKSLKNISSRLKASKPKSEMAKACHEIAADYSFVAGPGVTRAIQGYRAFFFLHVVALKEDGTPQRVLVQSPDDVEFNPAIFVMQIVNDKMVPRQITVNFRFRAVVDTRSPHYGAIEIGYNPSKQGAYILTVFCNGGTDQLTGCPTRLTVASAASSNFSELFGSVWKPELGQIICRFFSEPRYHKIAFEKVELRHLEYYLYDKTFQATLGASLEVFLSFDENKVKVLKKWGLDFAKILLRSFVWVNHPNLFTFVSRLALHLSAKVENEEITVGQFTGVFSLKTVVVLLIQADRSLWTEVARIIFHLTSSPSFFNILKDECNKKQAHSLRNTLVALFRTCVLGVCRNSSSHEGQEENLTTEETKKEVWKARTATFAAHSLARIAKHHLPDLDDAHLLLTSALSVLKDTSLPSDLRCSCLELISVLWHPDRDFFSTLYQSVPLPKFSSLLLDIFSALQNIITLRANQLSVCTGTGWEDCLASTIDIAFDQREKEREEREREREDGGNVGRGGSRVRARGGGRGRGKVGRINVSSFLWSGGGLGQDRKRLHDPLLYFLEQELYFALMAYHHLGNSKFLGSQSQNISKSKSMYDFMMTVDSQQKPSPNFFIALGCLLRSRNKQLKWESLKVLLVLINDFRVISDIKEHCFSALATYLSFCESDDGHLMICAVLEKIITKYSSRGDQLSFFHVVPEAISRLLQLFLNPNSPASGRREVVDLNQRKNVGIVLAQLTKFEPCKPHLMQKGGIPFLEQLLGHGLQASLHHDIPHNEVRFEKLIGKGSAGDVWIGTWGDKTYAFKRTDPTMKLGFNQQEFEMEVAITSVLSHRRVVASAGACTVPSHLFIAFRYYTNGALSRLIHESFSYDQSFWLQAAIDIADGMRYLHSCGIIHGDLKPDNVLIDSNLQMSVADFGSCHFESGEKTGIGTMAYTAPELLTSQKGDKSADVYSFGIILWEMIHRRYPWENPENKALQLLLKSNWRPECDPASTPIEIEKLIVQCWADDISQRPTFEEICSYLQAFLSKTQNRTYNPDDPDDAIKVNLLQESESSDDLPSLGETLASPPLLEGGEVGVEDDDTEDWSLKRLSGDPPRKEKEEEEKSETIEKEPVKWESRGSSRIVNRKNRSSSQSEQGEDSGIGFKIGSGSRNSRTRSPSPRPGSYVASKGCGVSKISGFSGQGSMGALSRTAGAPLKSRALPTPGERQSQQPLSASNPIPGSTSPKVPPRSQPQPQPQPPIRSVSPARIPRNLSSQGSLSPSPKSSSVILRDTGAQYPQRSPPPSSKRPRPSPPTRSQQGQG